MSQGHDVRLITRKNLSPEARTQTYHRIPQPGWEEIGCPTIHLDVRDSDSWEGGKWLNRVLSLLNPYVVPSYMERAWVLASAQVLEREIDQVVPDVVLTTQYSYNYLAALIARRKRRFVWIASINDPWEKMALFESPSWCSHWHHYHRRLLSLLASKADAFIFPSKRLELFERKFSYGPWPSHVDIIPHVGAVAERVAPRNYEKFRLVHAGELVNVGKALCKLPEAITEATRRMPGLKADLEMVLVGDAPTDFKNRMAAVVGSAFQCVPWCAYPTALEYIASADVNVLIEANYPEGVLMLAKLADYALVPKPILALSPRIGYMADMAQKGQCLHAPPDDEALIAEKILALHAAWKAGNLASYSSHSELAEICKPETAAAKFENLFQSIAEGTVN
jgi:hypothetical protein